MSEEDRKIGIDDVNKVYGNPNEMGIYINKAYIDSLTLNIDITEKIKEYWNSFLNILGDAWDRLLRLPEKREVDKVE